MVTKVLFEPYPKQQECVDAAFSGNYTFVCYGGGMGGGKTVVDISILLLLCKAYPGSRWCVVRESIPTLKRTTLETFKKLLPTNFVKHINQQEHIYTFKNDSRIFFMAEDYANDKDFDRFKGLEVNGFLLEQIEELQKGLLDICFIRAGRWKIPKMPPRPLILANVNPTLEWPREEIYDKYNNDSLPDRWLYIPAKISDNPALFNDEAYMESLTMNLDPLMIARFIDGDWDAFAVDSPYMYNFKMSKHVRKEPYKPNPHLPILISFDFNVEPMTAVVTQPINLLKAITFDEVKIKTGSVEEICDELWSRYSAWEGIIYVTGDASGRAREKVKKGNVNAYQEIKTKLKIKDTHLKVPDSNMAHKDSRTLCASIQYHAQWEITSNCKESIKDCSGAQVDEKGELIKTKGKGRHFFDNIRYTLHAIWPDFITNPYKYKR